MQHHLVLLVLAACGSVRNNAVPDAGATPDSAPGVHPITLSQTNSSDMTDGIACTGPNSAPLAMQYLLENSFYRVFTLADYGVTTVFKVDTVSFGVFSASAGAMANQPADVTVYAYSGTPADTTIDLSKLTPLGSAAVQIPNTAAPTMIQVPVTAAVPADVHTLVVELHVNSGLQAMYRLFVGINSRGERAPAFLRSPSCGNTSPTPVGQLYPGDALLLSVAGET